MNLHQKKKKFHQTFWNFISVFTHKINIFFNYFPPFTHISFSFLPKLNLFELFGEIFARTLICISEIFLFGICYFEVLLMRNFFAGYVSSIGIMVADYVGGNSMNFFFLVVGWGTLGCQENYHPDPTTTESYPNQHPKPLLTKKEPPFTFFTHHHIKNPSLNKHNTLIQ
jgi:hypothetical protein